MFYESETRRVDASILFGYNGAQKVAWFFAVRGTILHSAAA